MWNKLFKSKSKSSKNLSSASSSNGSTSTAPVASPPLDLVPIYNHETDIDFRRNNNRDDDRNRDSIGAQMCGIPMRKSKFSNAFKSLSLRRGSSKNQLKLYPGAGEIPIGDDAIEISTAASKRASLRPSKSDNNLNEKQNYADQEKDDEVYSEQYIQQPVVDPFLVIPEPPENLELQQCPICTRNFVPTSLAKHIGICEKMQSKKRKPFDSSRQRREGTELASYLPKNFGLPQNHPQARASPPKTTNPVRKLSTSKTPTPQRKDYGDNGINHLMSSSLTLSSTTAPVGTSPNAAMAANSSSTTPRPILKRSLSQQNEPCPYCERCFGFKAFDRHVEWCREKALLTKNAHNNNSISAAKERLQARIQYKAPQIKSKRALNREKYSGSLSCGGSTNSLADLDLPLPRHRSHLNSMSSSISSDNGFTPDRYDPFMSAKRQLEELFSPTSGYNSSTQRQQQNNSRSTTPLTPTANCMSKSVITPTTKTSPVINSNFRRASSLRMPRKVSRPMFIEKAKSNIQKGITDDGPVSPNFLKSSEYDEIPIKSAFNALQMAEKPKMRDSSTARKNLKLDIKDPNMPATDVPLSKTDSLAVFLKYEHELNLAAMSEKDMKDKSNSLSKRSLSLGGHERKESMLYGGVTGNGLKIDRSPQDEKDKAEKILQDIQPFKKLPQKLIPIKLEPINITYSNNNSSQKTINNVNNSSKSNNTTKNNNNNNNNINSNNTDTSKPAIISLDVILGKKPKPPPPPPPPKEEKENRKDPNYIDPKLINKCDNLPITTTKLSSSESECSIRAAEVAKKPTDSNRLCKSPNSSPENSSGETGGTGCEGQQPIIENKLTNDNRTNDDTRPTLTRQNGAASCSSNSSRGTSSREESPVEQQPRSPLARNQSHLDETKPQTPDSGLERLTPKPSTPIPVQKKPERPPLPSFDDFDFDEFISSFEDERRSFKNALYARSTISNCNTNSSNSTSFVQNANSSVLDNSVMSVTSLNGSVSSTSSPSHFNSSNSPHYSSLTNNGRSEESPTAAHQPKEPPQVPRRRHIGEVVHTPSHSTIRNLPSLQGSIANKPTDLKSPKPSNAFGPINDSINNNSSPLLRDNPSSSRLGSGNSFNHHHQPYQHHQQQQQQQQQHQPSTANHTNNNTISAHLVPQPYTPTALNTGSPLFEYHSNSRHQSPLSNATNGSNGSGVGGPPGGGGTGGDGGIIFDDLSPTERDLMKSVQELDRMCESSSSMYPADSDEMSSVEGYPLSNSSRDHGSARHHHHRSERPSAEGSKFSADSAYGSLSRQSPPDQHHTIRRAYGHHRGGSKSTNATSQPDAFDNSSGSESSLPPITATLKTQKLELHAHKATPAVPTGPKNAASLQMSKFCHECGSRFMVDTAKFCMECGIRRIMLD